MIKATGKSGQLCLPLKYPNIFLCLHRSAPWPMPSPSFSELLPYHLLGLSGFVSCSRQLPQHSSTRKTSGPAKHAHHTPAWGLWGAAVLQTSPQTPSCCVRTSSLSIWPRADTPRPWDGLSLVCCLPCYLTPGPLQYTHWAFIEFRLHEGRSLVHFPQERISGTRPGPDTHQVSKHRRANEKAGPTYKNTVPWQRRANAFDINNCAEWGLIMYFEFHLLSC